MSFIRTASAVLLVGWLADPALGAARTWQVRDSFVFSPEVRKEVNDPLLELKDKYAVDLVVRTVKAGKAKPAGTARADDPTAKAVKDYAKNLGGRDILVLIFQEPPESDAPYVVAVLVGKEIEHAFPADARERLRTELAAALRPGDQARADDGLRAAVDLIGTTLRASLGAAPFGMPEALSIVVPFLGVWLFLEVVGRLIALRVPAEGPALDPVDHNGGGSFLPAMFAALAAGDLPWLWRRTPAPDARRSASDDTVLLPPDNPDLDATVVGEVAPPAPPADHAADPTLCDTRSYPGPTP